MWMKVRGPNYQVRFLRQKEQAQYKWKANEKWIVAVYNVQESEITENETEELEENEEVQIKFKAPKTEIEVRTLFEHLLLTAIVPQLHIW